MEWFCWTPGPMMTVCFLQSLPWASTSKAGLRPPNAKYQTLNDRHFFPCLARPVNGVEHLHELNRLTRTVDGGFFSAHTAQKVVILLGEFISPERVSAQILHR